ncbi:MAG: phosphoglycerate kinase, partial [Candidatus Buchananbacteria bacterium]|nr:phosphoglycerate kinase [Candidatus Buchananbacteria bacterium]
MHLKTLKSAKDLKGKKVLLRVAYDVPLKQEGKKWVVADETRIAATLPTLKYLLRQKAKIVLLSWLGRPDGHVVDKYKMDPVAKALSKLIKKPVKKLDDCIGPKVFGEIQKLKNGQILMLENTRFYPEEEKANKRFAKLLVHGLDLIVFDAFAQAHRVHASTTEITKMLPTYAGLLLEKEIKALSGLVENPQKPFVVVLGGAKLSDKIGVLNHLVSRADKILIGGAAANVFLKASRVPIGNSFIQDSFVDKAKSKKISAVKLAKKMLKNHKNKFVLPVDLLATNNLDKPGFVELIDLSEKTIINKTWLFVDIGPKTIKEYSKILKKAKTIFWNGPMGVFEIDKFALGTKKIAQAIASNKNTTILGGGDTESVLSKYKLEKKFTHVSTGGGASLEFLAGKHLPAL